MGQLKMLRISLIVICAILFVYLLTHLSAEFRAAKVIELPKTEQPTVKILSQSNSTHEIHSRLEASLPIVNVSPDYAHVIFTTLPDRLLYWSFTVQGSSDSRVWTAVSQSYHILDFMQNHDCDSLLLIIASSNAFGQQVGDYVYRAHYSHLPLEKFAASLLGVTLNPEFTEYRLHFEAVPQMVGDCSLRRLPERWQIHSLKGENQRLDVEKFVRPIHLENSYDETKQISQTALRQACQWSEAQSLSPQESNLPDVSLLSSDYVIAKRVQVLAIRHADYGVAMYSELRVLDSENNVLQTYNTSRAPLKSHPNLEFCLHIFELLELTRIRIVEAIYLNPQTQTAPNFCQVIAAQIRILE